MERAERNVSAHSSSPQQVRSWLKVYVGDRDSRTAESVGVNSPRNARETVGISGRGIIEQSSHVTGRAVI
jgi:hypothetical protein